MLPADNFVYTVHMNTGADTAPASIRIGLSEQADRTQFGFWLYILSDCVLFAGLFAVYAVLQGATFGGPTPYDLFDLPYVLVETVLLLTSSFTIGIATLLAYRGNKNGALAMLAVTLALGLGFVGMEVAEFTKMIAESAGPGRSAFLSGYFGLVGTHGLHVTLGSLWMLILMVYIGIRGLSASNMRKLISLSLFWHFLDIVWIFIFTFVYLFGLL
jgi:cytochrome o ubiquinol oxidase subunit III